MGEVKRRGTFEDRKVSAEPKANLPEFTQEEIAIATRVAKQAKCSVKKALITLQKVRKQNDEMAEKLGYQRTGNLANGVAMFSKSV